ncbi:MAG: PspC domain-containing protein [Candidatus Falkowbacteria bacterium]
MSEPIKKFYRSRTDRIIWGVCGGLGEYFGVDSTLIRIAFILLAFGSGVGVMLYIILALLVPNSPEEKIKASEKVDVLAEELGDSAKKISDEMKKNSDHHTRNIIGLIILTLGVAMLLKEAFHLYINWGLIYPFMIVLLGLYLLDSYNKNNKQK